MVKKNTSSASRRTDIVSAAIEVFAETGYYRATTAQVAERAAISQPYVYRFFTKESLLVEALEVSWQRIETAFRQVLESASPDTLERGFIEAYEGILVAHGSEILLQMQAQTMREEAVRKAMQEGMSRIKRLVLNAFEEAEMEDAERRTSDFLARGMLCNVSMAIGLPDLMLKK